MTPLGSGPLLAEVCNLFTIFTLVQRENGDHTHPRMDGKLTISTGSMVFINHILPLTETHHKEGKWGPHSPSHGGEVDHFYQKYGIY